MKAIKVNTANAERINAALSEIEGRATARTLDADDLIEIAERSEKEVAARTFLPKSHQTGAVVTYRMGLNLPNRYRYAPEYTEVTLGRRKSGWFLLSARRVRGNVKQAEYFAISLSQEAAAEAKRRFEAGFSVRDEAS